MPLSTSIIIFHSLHSLVADSVSILDRVKQVDSLITTRFNADRSDLLLNGSNLDVLQQSLRPSFILTNWMNPTRIWCTATTGVTKRTNKPTDVSDKLWNTAGVATDTVVADSNVAGITVGKWVLTVESKNQLLTDGLKARNKIYVKKVNVALVHWLRV